MRKSNTEKRINNFDLALPLGPLARADKTGRRERSGTMRLRDVRFYREQVERCRDLVRLTDELRRLLSGMAAEFDARAREAENVVLQRRIEKSPSPVLRPQETRVEPLTISIKDAAKVLGLGRSTIYRLIGEQQLETVKIGNRTLIKTASIGRLVEQPGGTQPP